VHEVAKLEASNCGQTNFTTVRDTAVEDIDDGWSWNEE
jgi:hypothetical protein